MQIVDSKGGAITANHSYTWCGSARCLAHDNTQSGSPVSTQYFSQGAIIAGTPYYYVQDRLGSVTQLVSTTGAVATQYTYDPYGNRTTVSSTVVADIGYAGYFTHSVSGLDFTLHRAYDPVHARWVNRDPIGEAGGVNLYAYADQNPATETDPLGLDGDFSGLLLGANPGEGAGYAIQQQLSDIASQAWNFVTANFGFNAGYHQGPLGNSLEAGGAVGGNGAVCAYVTQCSTAGWGHMAAGGFTGGVTVGTQACTGVTPSAGVFGVAGDGVVGGGQATAATDGSASASVSFRSQFGGGAAAGTIGCVQYMACL